VIVAHSTHANQPPEGIELDGREYPYIATGSDADWAELLEVKP
jgi:hypothetical protein